MAIPSLELHSKSQSDIYPLLMEQPGNQIDTEHVIDITRSGDASSSNSSNDGPSTSLDQLQHDDRPASSARVPISQPSFSSSNVSNSRNSFRRRADARRRRSPLNSGLWISIELALTVSQIIASIVVLSLSRHEHPHAPLFTWIVGYASGCVATLPILYWRFRHRNQGHEQESAQSRQVSFHSNLPGVPTFSLSVTGTSEDEDRQPSVPATRNSQSVRRLSARYEFVVLLLLLSRLRLCYHFAAIAMLSFFNQEYFYYSLLNYLFCSESPCCFKKLVLVNQFASQQLKLLIDHRCSYSTLIGNNRSMVNLMI